MPEEETNFKLADLLGEATDLLLSRGTNLLETAGESALQAAGLKIQTWLGQTVQDVEQWIYANLTLPLVESDLVPPEMRDDARYLTQIPTLASLFPAAGFAILGMAGHMKAYLQTFAELKSRQVREQHPIQIPSVGDLTNLQRLGIITPQDAEAVALQNGVSPEWYHLMHQGSLVWPQPGAVKELFLREQISEGEHDALLINLGWTKQAIDAQKVGYRPIPGPGELIRMAVREAWRDDFAEKWGSDDRFPAEFGEWFRKSGGTDYWAQKLWRAHWDLPSMQMAFAMLHRRIIDETELDGLMQAQDVMPGWRPKMTQLSYNPLTRVDVRRMYGLGVLDRDDVVSSYRDLGYSALNAERMTEFTVRYEAGAEKDLTKSEVIRGYREKILTTSETHTLLGHAGYSRSESSYLIALEDLKALREIEGLQVQRIKTLYLKGKLSEAHVRAGLGELGWNGDRTELTIDKWRIERLERDEIPSKQDWLRWFKIGMVDADTCKNELYNLGWDWKYADLYMREIMIGKRPKK